MHLTDFTLLVDKSPSDPILCNPALTVLGYVLVIGSAVCLLIMMGVQFLNLSKSARIHAAKFFETFPSMRFRVELIGFIYTSMLFLFYLFFGIFGDRAHISSTTVCSVFAAISYFLLLSCIFLTIFQAWRVLKLFAWSSKMENVLSFITRNTVIIVLSFFIPIAISLIGFLAEPNLFNRDDDFCWINASDIPWAVCPWALQYLTLFSKKATMWHYLFTIVNGSQGIILFALFVYRRVRARQTMTTLTSSQNNGETQQTETNNVPVDTPVKLRHPPAKQIMSLPTSRSTRVYENYEYAHAPSVPTHNRSPQLNLPPKAENSRFSKAPPHPDGNQPTNLAKNMYIY
ncbi:G-PROTEIN-RECEP-F2-4 domain-containing protein [Aphelenchoides bicaudatus]|nr:G-PROTEIN-RECEP-F2-4 domain-containing protein [Aphelenchoides bicaudatus]